MHIIGSQYRLRHYLQLEPYSLTTRTNLGFFSCNELKSNNEGNACQPFAEKVITTSRRWSLYLCTLLGEMATSKTTATTMLQQPGLSLPGSIGLHLPAFKRKRIEQWCLDVAQYLKAGSLCRSVHGHILDDSRLNPLPKSAPAATGKASFQSSFAVS